MSKTLHYTTLALVDQLSLGLAELIPEVGKDSFPRLLAETFKRFIPADEIMVVLFSDKPELLVFDQNTEAFPGDLEMYLAGAYLLDPFYKAGVQLKESYFASYRELAPEGFRQSEYFKQYLVKTGLVDECGYLVLFPEGQFLHLSFDRTRRMPKFSKLELQLLKSLTPLIDALCQQHWNGQLKKPLNRQLEQALANFASTKLTPRECEVIRLLLHGHSSKAIGKKLQISLETVRLHRRNSYRKLDIGTQSELFYLFIGSLMRFETYEGGDPLEGYF